MKMSGPGTHQIGKETGETFQSSALVLYHLISIIHFVVYCNKYRTRQYLEGFTLLGPLVPVCRIQVLSPDSLQWPEWGR
jgi:hypothetical protein